MTNQKRFKLGDEVWRVQHVRLDHGLSAYGPATVTAIIQRKDRETYLLSWEPNNFEITDEQDPIDLFPTKKEAKAEADERHNAKLRSQMR